MTPTAVVRRGAALSRCGTYRYALWREWDGGAPTVLFIGLNPSTADRRRDDPTIRRCIRFARDWGFGRLTVANLFALRATDPRVVMRAAAPVGPRNDRWLHRLSREASLVVVAWGVHGSHRGRDAEVLRMLPPPTCLGVTRGGAPLHPLYVRADARPVDLTLRVPLPAPAPRALLWQDTGVR